jgi:hypothetical protein
MDFLEADFDKEWAGLESSMLATMEDGSRKTLTEARLSLAAHIKAIQQSIKDTSNAGLQSVMLALEGVREVSQGELGELRAEFTSLRESVESLKETMQQTMAQNQAILAMMGQRATDRQEIIVKLPEPQEQKRTTTTRHIRKVPDGWEATETQSA